ncbi:potassium channel family protein [Clostridium sp. LIBA-8841]|uniref:potassium channel family protein n=1 Tax=Clostridium sp. LIBA-8841 TaxID=2987530 RepID=UPI002AC3C7A7|nr:potassium channel family protein [Clostridium sp. LIBA-8841]MDZ5253708.1 potassium channel family protein [Clostridium sp. LIBA-8841]
MHKKEKLNNLFMGFLSLIVALLLFVEAKPGISKNTLIAISIVNNIIWAIFCVDYFKRLIRSKNKKYFILHNKIDLISIIPIEGATILRINRFFRLLGIPKRVKKNFNKFIKTNNLHYMIYLVIIVVLGGAISLSVAENINIGDAIWWSIETVTTVGYGDIIPKTILGRTIASIVMMVGIGFISMFTSTIATYYIKKEKEKGKKTYKDSVLNDVKNKLDHFEKLSKDDIKNIYVVLNALKDEENGSKDKETKDEGTKV